MIKLPLPRVLSSSLFLAACLFTASSACDDGVTYYVNAESGDDRNDGRSPRTALATLKRGVAALDRSGGDTLVLSGVFCETLNINWINCRQDRSQITNRITTFRNATDENGRSLPAIIEGGIAPSAESFPFDCEGRPLGEESGLLDRGVIVSQCNRITIEGLEVRGVAGLGVLTWRSNHVTLRGMKVHWTTQSALMLSHGRFHDPPAKGLIVEDCRVSQSNLGRWLDRDNPDPRKRGYDMRSETVSIVKWDTFRVRHNHISNSLMEGIDFKEGSFNGEIAHNIVENCRSAGIYANEGRDTKIHHNIVRRIGYYDPEDGSGLMAGGAYLAKKIPGSNIGEPGATGILISTGDLNGPGRPPLEVGRVTGIEVFENLIYATRKAAISVWNEWRKEARDGWMVEDIRIENNTCYSTCHGPNPVSAAILFDAGATNIRIRNNIIVGSYKYDLEMWDRPNWPRPSSPPVRDISHNLFHDNAITHTAGEAPIRADPLFITIPKALDRDGDFRLREGSPAINAGVDTGPPRTDNTGNDLGAFAYGHPSWSAGVREDSASE